MGLPFLSYRARKKNGIITAIMASEARVTFPDFFMRKKSGTPMAAAAPKQMSWRLVRFRNTLLLTRVRSRGTFAYRFSKILTS